MRVAAIVLLLFRLAIPTHGQAPRSPFQSAELPKYPAIARAARVQGEVVVRLTTDPATHKVTEAEVVSGPPMLHEATIKFVKSIVFAAEARPSHEIHLLYLIGEPDEAEESATYVLNEGAVVVIGRAVVLSDPSAEIRKKHWWQR